MINLQKIKTLWSSGTPIEIEKNIQQTATARHICTCDDFGKSWYRLNAAFQLPVAVQEEKFIQLLLDCRQARKQDRAAILRNIQRLVPNTSLPQLSTRWWNLLVKTSWVEPGNKQLPGLKRAVNDDGRKTITHCNGILAHGMLALHIHLHSRNAMMDLQFFIADCEKQLPGVGKAAPYLARVSRQLQRSYPHLPRINKSSPFDFL